jgi:hypothetical protein
MDSPVSPIQAMVVYAPGRPIHTCRSEGMPRTARAADHLGRTRVRHTTYAVAKISVAAPIWLKW